MGGEPNTFRSLWEMKGREEFRGVGGDHVVMRTIVLVEREDRERIVCLCSSSITLLRGRGGDRGRIMFEIVLCCYKTGRRFRVVFLVLVLHVKDPSWGVARKRTGGLLL